jgi:alkylation response protein AidB-like acyl-CoA dehydrogenase
MSIDFEPDEMESAVRESLTGLCRQFCPESLARDETRGFPVALWRALADYGLFSLALSDGAGGIVEIAAAGDVLGKALAPGPLAETFFAAQVLPAADLAEILSGERIVSLGTPPLMPWANAASVFLACDGENVWRLEKAHKTIEFVEMLGGGDWGHVELVRSQDIGRAERAIVVHDIFLAAYLAGAARKLVGGASEYVANRRQFGKTLSQFQAVSHPLAECAIRLRAASTLARIAAHQAQAGLPDAALTASCARASAENAALQSAYVCHQAYGAMGITADGPVYFVSRRLRQLASRRWSTSARPNDIERSYLPAGSSQLQIAQQ